MAGKAKRAATRGARERPGEYVGFRAPAELKAKLEKAAGAKSRSLSSEAQFRLEQSFDIHLFMHDALSLAYGPKLAGLVLMIARAMHDAGYQAILHKNLEGDDAPEWTNDPHAFNEAVKAVDAILKSAAPPGEIVPPKLFDNFPADKMPALRMEYFKYPGTAIAGAILRAISGGSVSTDLDAWAGPIREMLGELGNRIARSPLPSAIIVQGKHS